MTRPEGSLAAPFPAPSPVLAAMMDELRLAATIGFESARDAQRVAALPRPWDPASCDPEVRNVIYVWLEAVVSWINADHTWRVEQMLPVCWMEHPHLVHELAVVACERWEASFTFTPGAIEAWQHYTLPGLLERTRSQVGSACPPGRHQAHPGQVRIDLLDAAEAQRRHRQLRIQDQEP